MIDDATIKRIMEKHTTSVFIPIDVFAFAEACYAAGQDAQMKHALYIGAVTEDGVVWANQNPSSYPAGAMFYAVIPKEP